MSSHSLNLHSYNEDEIKQFRKHLIDFYEETKRVLPWRKQGCDLPQKDAPLNEWESPVQRLYEVLVSEIMLQQTRVETVKRYYNKWMETLPTLQACAEADYNTQVMPLWSGMGFYTRCKRLHQACQYLAGLIPSEIPLSAEKWAKDIPGVGPYTAGAVLSIAWKQRTGIVDGNVIRVLSRAFAVHSDCSKGKANTLIWELANALVDPERPGDFNQALMELGAVTCTPQSPQCSICPISDICKGYQEQIIISDRKELKYDIEDGPCNICSVDPPSAETLQNWVVNRYPIRPQKTKQREERALVVIFQKTDPETKEKLYLIRKRPTVGLLAGLWDFPTIEYGENAWPKDMEAEFQRCLDLWLQEENLCVKKHQTRGRYLHIFSHIRKTSHVFYAIVTPETKTKEDFFWISQSDLEHVGMCELGLKNYRGALDLKKRKLTTLSNFKAPTLISAKLKNVKTEA
ncbi:DNA adenine glycosylase Myh1 [Schizosaccharomyces osmophilus]|uniref:Adenine DNA glycosylase n=1 Tax=Schizosaccharomyces osmophilus TaxID=2545709 RepID=A0AAE9W9F4_9SCHI|nr:DNA adenine glycosylase Myh1 [Schizosaccharomyces osmophilus]WBW71785.1 DNA adenine glycosylase Myh1 [Schizosaccharomyces osmophilus]